MIQAGEFPYKDKSLLAAGARLGIPVTVHVAIGTDIIHMHPSFDGKATGEAAARDFQKFCSLVADLEGGVYINLGSAVLLPEIFLKAVTLCRNLGHTLKHFTTVNMDFIQHYRPNTNVVRRPDARRRQRASPSPATTRSCSRSSPLPSSSCPRKLTVQLLSFNLFIEDFQTLRLCFEALAFPKCAMHPVQQCRALHDRNSASLPATDHAWRVLKRKLSQAVAELPGYKRGQPMMFA